MIPEQQTVGLMLDIDGLPAEDAVLALVRHTAELGASDLMFLTNQDVMAVQVRHLGLVRPVAVVGRQRAQQMVQYVKAQSGMDLTESRRPLDGRWVVPVEVGDEAFDADLRVSTVPTLHGEDMVLRLLSRVAGMLTLDDLGFLPDQLEAVRGMLGSPGGLVLCTGPTGSGKTATLYAFLQHLHTSVRKINTIEDPVEFALEGVRQSQVNTALGLGFADLLRGVLRQAPDVIMIGEIRDEQTAITAVRAANSGHLVLSTLHAPVAVGALDALRALGVPNAFLASALRGIISQRLVRTLDPDTRLSFDIGDDAETFEPVRPLLKKGEGSTLFAADRNAKGGGYAGRTGVFEVMAFDDALSRMVSHHTDAHTIYEKAREHGMLDFRRGALLKVARGETSMEEVFRVLPAEVLA